MTYSKISSEILFNKIKNNTLCIMVICLITNDMIDISIREYIVSFIRLFIALGFITQKQSEKQLEKQSEKQLEKQLEKQSHHKLHPLIRNKPLHIIHSVSYKPIMIVSRLIDGNNKV